MQLRLNLGCGRKLLAGWVNVDAMRYPDADYHGVTFAQDDALAYLHALPDGSVAEVLAEQFLEHLTYREGALFLAECKRVLAPDGQVRITVPDFEAHIGDYRDRQQRVPLRDRRAIDGPFRPEVNLLIRTVYAEPWGHQAFYDAEMLRTAIEGAGLRVVRMDRPDGANVVAVAGRHTEGG